MANIQFPKLSAPGGSPELGPKIDHAVLHLSREELATIFFALQEYKQNVLKTVDEVHAAGQKVSNGIEDEMFCYEQASRCAKLQYDIRWDGHTADEIKWMDF